MCAHEVAFRWIINRLLLFHFNNSCKATFERNEAAAAAVETMKERPTWANKTEFLMSCIQTSVGLGNIWRFPFTAYENGVDLIEFWMSLLESTSKLKLNSRVGGGAFLIPYIIVLFVIGKPMYYLESYLGQFVSQSSIKIWEVNPAFRGLFYFLWKMCIQRSE